jgi:hypothetical protein
MPVAAPVTMTTKLDKPLRRELKINGQPYVLTVTPEALKLVPKGKRLGLELRWTELVSGEAALATALNASLHALPAQSQKRNDRAAGTAIARRQRAINVDRSRRMRRSGLKAPHG